MSEDTKHSGEKLKTSGPGLTHVGQRRGGTGGVPVGGGGTSLINKRGLLDFPSILACSPVHNTRELRKMWEVAKGVVFTLSAP